MLAKISIDGQVRLVHLVRLQMDNFSLFLRKQMDKRQTSIARRANAILILKKLPRFHFPFSL